MPSQNDIASSQPATPANPPTPTSNAKPAAPASTPKPPATAPLPTVAPSQLRSKFTSECIILARLPNGTVYPVIYSPSERVKHPAGVRVFDDAEAAIVEMSSGKLASLNCAIVPLKDLF